jgi:predicted RNA-binding protein with PIN domain
MRYLIDGYNLLHAMGVLHGQTGPAVLERARLRLLGLLRGRFGERAGDVTVVFDAAHAPANAVEAQDYHGIRVRFAVHESQADDLIEQLIRHDSAPGKLTVVSDDRRLQQAGRRRHCPVQSCGDFLDHIVKPPRQSQQPALKPDGGDQEYWLKEFADLEKDPNFKELFEPFEFM